METNTHTQSTAHNLAVSSGDLLGAPWNDVTTYSRNETVRIPRTWRADFGRLRITVTRNIHYAPDVWVVTCHKLGIEQELQATNLHAAATEAIEVVKTDLDSLRGSFA